LQKAVAAVLIVDLRFQNAVNDQDGRERGDRHRGRQRNELALPRLTALLAMRKKVDADNGHAFRFSIRNYASQDPSRSSASARPPRAAADERDRTFACWRTGSQPSCLRLRVWTRAHRD